MGERLNFRAVGVPAREAVGGIIAYQATAEGVTYRVVSTPLPGSADRRARTFRAYRVSQTPGAPLLAALSRRELARASAIQQCEADLDDVLRDRAAASGVPFGCDGDPCTVLHHCPHPAESSFAPGATLKDSPDPMYPEGEPDPATTDDTQELMDRVIRRAQYLALQAALTELDRAHAATGMTGPVWSRDSIGRMVNDAARALGTAEPYRVAP
jgi:hypothetical protein